MRLRQQPNLQDQRGFTLVELVIVIVLLGIVGGIVAVFMRRPIDAYFASQRRSALSDVADTTVRRIARDLHRALPNSIRLSGSSCMEFIPTKTGGRYRAQDSQPGDSLDFSIAATKFNMLGDNSTLPPDQQIATGDLIVVYNLQIPGSDAYDATNVLNSKNWTTVSSAPIPAASYVPVEWTIPVTAFKFPLPSPSYRFHVVPGTEQMVSYVCSGSKLYRATSSVPSAAASCPTSTGGAATVSILASNVNCAATSFTYSGSDLQRNALVTMVLSLQDDATSATPETVTLQHEVHVDNTP